MKTPILSLILGLIFSLVWSNTLLAQRNYANSKQVGVTGLLCAACGVTNPDNAVDGNLQTYSSLNVSVGLAAQTYEELIFPSPVVASGTPVHIKVGTGDGLLSLNALGGVSLRAYNGAAPVGAAVTIRSLVTAVSNNNQLEVSFTPTQPYDRIRVTLNGGLLGALSNFYVYDAYYNGSGAVACNSAIDELHGISSAILGLGVNAGGVANPQLAIDGNINTASTLNAGVGVAGAYAQQTVIYQSPSAVGDSVKITISLPQTLITANVLSSIAVSTANGSTDNNDAHFLNSSTLTVRLLDLTAGRQKLTVTFVPQNVFDRVQLRLGGGIANVLSTLNFYEAQRIIPNPVITFNGGSISNIQICAGSTATLTAAPVANTVFNWYTVPTGGSPVFTGLAFTTPPLTATTTYYVEAMRNGCTDASQRIPVTVNVLPLPAGPVIANTSVNICSGQSATFTATAVTGVTFNWYSAATGGTLLFSGNSFTTSALTQTTNYYAEAANSNGCVSSQRVQVTAVISPVPTTPVTAAATPTINPGQTNTITITNPQAGVTYNWYTSATGGTAIYTGTSFMTPALSVTTTYYIETVSGPCAIPARTAVTVTVNSVGPDVTVTPPTQSINSGQTATFTASSTTTNATFNWYTTPTGGTPVFTGATFTTPPITANTTYYAEAVDPATNLPSSPRATGTVTINPTGPDVAVTPPTQSVNYGQTATFTASSTTVNATFNWYTTATGGTPIFTGAAFTTPAVTANTTYYAEAVDPVTNLTSSPRAAGTVTLNPPAVTVTPPTQNVNSGQTATFTASSTTPNATFNWYTTATGGTPVFTGATFTTPPITVNTTYYAEAVDPATNTASMSRATGIVLVNTPDVTVTPSTQSVNSGQTAIFNASSTTAGVTFNWYTTPTGGTPIFTGATFTTPPITTNTTFYAEAVDPATNLVSSSRATGTVTVNAPDVTVTPPTQNVNSGQSATFTASSTVPSATFNWYTTPTGGTPVFTGATFTTPPITANTVYYAEAVDPATNLASAPRATATVMINPPDVAVTPSSQSVNSGQTATFTASSTTAGVIFNWYTTATGGTPVFTGATFTTPPITANTTYYAEAVDPVTNLISSPRATGTVTVNPPDVTVTPPTQGVNSGQSATFTASSTVPGAMFNWYTTATGGTPIFTGATFITPPVTANTTYYAEAVDPITTLASSTRATATVTVNAAGSPDVAVTPPTQSVNSGQTATFTASSTTAGATFNWYTTPTGGTPVFTGAVFTTQPITTNTTYYAEAVDPVTTLASSTRATGTVTVNNLPSITVTPSNQSVNSGQTATFTASSTTPNATFNWYTAATGGIPVFTGATFTTPPVTANTTYYAEAVDPVTNLASSPKATGTVNVNSLPDVTVTPPSQTINSGQTATFTASSTTANATFNWYSTPTGGTPIFTGSTFTTPSLTANTTYYAEAVDPVTNLASSPRATGTVTVNSLPDITVTPSNQNVNSGQTATFTASSTTANATFNWYTTPTGGTSVFTGATFITPPVTINTTYYAEAVDPVTTLASSPRATGTVNVNAAPSITVTPPSQSVSSGQTATFTASSTTPNATFNWYTMLTGGTPIFTGDTFITPPLTANTTYYAEAVDPATNAVSSPRATGTVTVNSLPDVTVTPPTQNVNSGQTATFTASSTVAGATFNWYTTPTGGTPIFTGAAFVTPPLTANTTYYAEAVDPVTNAVSSPRATGTVTVNSLPDVTVTPATQSVNSGQTATFTASSTVAGAAFNWYTTPTGGTSIFTGATFVTPPVTANTTYYAEAVDPSTNAASSPRATGTVTVNSLPDVTVTPPTQNVNSGQTATFTASSTVAGATFNWYTTPTGGTPIFTGATFVTPPVTANTTYYAEAVDPSTNAASSPRATGTVNVNNLPDVTVTPPTQNVNTGQTATFTTSSTIAGAAFNWYTTPTGGTPVFTGSTFITPPVTANTTYYAEAVDPSTNAASSPRATGTVNVNPSPSITVTPPTQSVNSGQSATFTASSTTPGSTFNWYTTPTGGTPIFTGATFVTPPVTANVTYYAEAVDPSTGAVSSPRATGTVTLNGSGPNNPSVTVTPPIQNVNNGQSATFTASSTTPGSTFNWYTTPTGGTPVFTGSTFVTPPITANVTYYAEAVDPSGAVSSPRATGTVVLNAAIPDIAVTPPMRSVIAGQTVTFTASSTTPGATFNWYTAATGGSPIFIGPTFTTPGVFNTTTYYAEAVSPAGGVSARATAIVNVVASSSLPDVTVTPPVRVILAGQSTNFTASSKTANATFNWYDASNSEVPVFTGSVYTTPVLNANAKFWVEAVDPVSNAVSANRALATVTITTGQDIFIPSAFSPNGDGRNDQLNVYGAAVKQSSMYVYDQWGQMLFHSDNMANGWDGTYKGVAQPVGVYVYYVKVTLTDNSTISKKGTITLIR